MDTPMLIAYIMWIGFIVTWISLFVNRAYFEKMIDDMENNFLLLFISGIMTMVLWLLVILHVNTFESLYLGVITIIWWMMFIKWVMYMICPRWMIAVAKKMRWIIKYIWIFWFLYIALWICLLYNVNFIWWFM